MPLVPNDLIIYEMHVRGFTQDPSSNVKYPGTYLGLVEKIPHLKALGITAVELLPIFPFDETSDYWGYSPIDFFSPTQKYATLDPVKECNEMIAALHEAGIAVILDVVYNHAGNGHSLPSNFFFQEKDFTCCGNTLNTNAPQVKEFILSSLRYWTDEMNVDGFRVDLASVFCRGEKGQVLESPPIVEAINADPVLKNCILIAEPWDCAGLYQVGNFPGGWKEWNGAFRDEARAHINFGGPPPTSDRKKDINFITAHDGFTLRDLVSYEKKHNEVNGEENQDGSDNNLSTNCGHEGPSDDPQINALREKKMRALLQLLFSGKGSPMLLMGDEYGHSRNGNNNPYNQDNQINYFNWDFSEDAQNLQQYVCELIHKRRSGSNVQRADILKK